MGMFDYLHCYYPLPGKPPYGPEGHGGYQTKNLTCGLDLYKITENGELLVQKFTPDGELEVENGSPVWKKVNYTGVINFYDSNICASGPGFYTNDGSDAVSVDYQAKFLNGVLVDLKETSLEVGPALPSHTNKVYRDYEEAYPEMPQDLKRIYVLWGSVQENEKGYYGKVESISNKDICIKVEGDHTYKKDGDLEIVQKWQWGSTIFLNEEDAFAHRDARKNSWNKYKKIYDDYAAEWHKKREQK